MSQSRHRQSNHSKSRRAAFPRTPEAHQRANVGSDQPEASNLFSDLLREAVTRPGIISEAYHAFHTFSLGNQILAASQLIERGMAISPIASFSAWQSKGRMVRKVSVPGELCAGVPTEIWSGAKAGFLIASGRSV